MRLRKLRLAVKLLFALAALWSLVAGARILLTPSWVQTATAVSVAGGTESPEAADEVQSEVRSLSYYEAQGPWGLIVLLLFASPYLGSAALVWRQRTIAGTLLGLVGGILTVLAGFSIGLFYLPAALTVLLGMLGLGALAFWDRYGSSAAS